MEEDLCSICYDPLHKQFSHTLSCNHTFHYECLYKSFKEDWLNMCPYCRSENNKLPIVNGIKKIYPNIHNTENIDTYKNIPCNYIIQRGKNKGTICNKNCMYGEYQCTRHIKKK